MAARPGTKRLALAAMPLAVAVAVVLGEVDHGVSDRPPRQSAGSSRGGGTVIGRAGPTGPPQTAQPTAHRAEAEDAPGRPPHDRDAPRGQAAQLAARRFLRALLRFELEGATPRVSAAIRASATPALARFVLMREPRAVRGAHPQRGRLVALEPLASTARARAEFAATIDRPGGRSALIMTVRHGAGGWRVSDLR